MTEVLFTLGLLALVGAILYGLGTLRDAHNQVLDRERKRRFYRSLAEQELSRAKEAWTRGDVQAYEFHRSSYNSLAAKQKEIETKG